MKRAGRLLAIGLAAMGLSTSGCPSGGGGDSAQLKNEIKELRDSLDVEKGRLRTYFNQTGDIDVAAYTYSVEARGRVRRAGGRRPGLFRTTSGYARHGWRTGQDRSAPLSTEVSPERRLAPSTRICGNLPRGLGRRSRVELAAPDRAGNRSVRGRGRAPFLPTRPFQLQREVGRLRRPTLDCPETGRLRPGRLDRKPELDQADAVRGHACHSRGKKERGPGDQEERER